MVNSVMDYLTHILPIIIYMLLIIFLVICIVIGLKIIKTMNKVDGIVDNVEGKVNSLNGLFNIIDKTSLKLNGIFEKSSDLVTKIVDKVLSIKIFRNTLKIYSPVILSM